VPDAPGLELLARELGEAVAESVLATRHFRGQATIDVVPAAVPELLEILRAKGFTFLASLHGVDYWPEEPRFGVHYLMLDMQALDRVGLRTRVPLDDPHVPSVTPRWPTADHQEREAFDMFGIVFDGHPDLRRILMPEDYEGFPQRRDFPIGGEPVLFSKDIATGRDYTQWRNE
jgi:NADH-quinone oxidoreductase subunit C